MKNVLSLLALLLAVSGCGKTAGNCEACGDAQSGSSPGGSAGAGGSGFAGSSVAGQSNGGVINVTCPIGAPDVPLVRYSARELQWTLDAVLGPGPGFEAEASDRSGYGESRSSTFSFVRALQEVAFARAEAAVVDETRLQVCEADVDASCLDGWIAEIGLRLYRRPLTADQLEGYLAQFAATQDVSNALTAARLVLRTMMLSPYFVFRIELGDDTAQQLEAPSDFPAPPQYPTLPKGTRLSQYEVAARLGHFALRRGPDAQLLARAASGDFAHPGVIEAELSRLQQDPAGVFAHGFLFGEWLQIDLLASGKAGEERALAEDMQTQTTMFVALVLQARNGSFHELLTNSAHHLNQRLAQHYRLDVQLGETFELVELDPRINAGVLSQGAFLTRNPTPTYRGVSIMRDVLCAEPPAPPIVPMDGFVGATPRERITNATASSPACNSCHNMFDPIGFALEAFDDQGRLSGLDTTGALNLPSFGGPRPLAGPAELGNELANSPDARQCMGRHYLEHLLDRRYASPLDDAFIGCFYNQTHDADLDLNRLARTVGGSDAVQRMTRPASKAVGVSRATNPLEHAIEETKSLAAGLPADARLRLDEYAGALREAYDGLPTE